MYSPSGVRKLLLPHPESFPAGELAGCGNGYTRVMSLLERIVVDPSIFGGKPVVRGLRIKVETVLALLEQGATHEETLRDYPDLEPDDIRACLAYARALVANETVEAVSVAGTP